jgi:hypothetical protein
MDIVDARLQKSNPILQSSADNAAAFLRALWADPPDAWFLVWLKDGKHSLWFRTSDLDAAAAAAALHASRTDVYLGCALSPADNGPGKRCKAEDVIAIPGLWGDVDIRNAVHKKENLPPDVDSALSLLGAMPLPPSLVVHSGYGLQPWWLFLEPWLLQSDDERQQAAAFSVRWQAHLQRLAAERGWEMDSTADLARVLRLPGTLNRKLDPPVAVTVDIPAMIRRYDPADLRDALPEEGTGKRKNKLCGKAVNGAPPIGEVIKDGDRNNTLASLGGSLRQRALDENVIRTALLAVNAELCRPPLPEAEVRGIARSMAGYEPGASPTSNGTTHKTAEAGLQTSPLSRLRPKPIFWIAPPYIPLGKVVLFAGDGGHGKSTLTLHLASCLSRGVCAFGLSYPDPLCGETLLIQCEDSYEDTVIPRLLAFGADLSKIHRQEGICGADGKLAPFSLAHYKVLEKTLHERPALKQVIIDPAGAYVGTAVDDYRDSELRSLLDPLAELADRCAVSIVLIKHFSKTPYAKAVSKIGGSVGYTNSVRAAYVLLPDEEHKAQPEKTTDENEPKRNGLIGKAVGGEKKERVLFLPCKYNLGKVPKGLAFHRDDLATEDVDAILQPYPELTEKDRRRIGEVVFTLVWEGKVNVTADGHLASVLRAERGQNKVEQCTEWLKLFLRDYAYPDNELQAAAKKEGFSPDNLKDAKARLRSADPPLQSKAKGFQGGWWNGFGDPDGWTLRPQTGAPDSPQTPQTGKTPQKSGGSANSTPPQTGQSGVG